MYPHKNDVAAQINQSRFIKPVGSCRVQTDCQCMHDLRPESLKPSEEGKAVYNTEAAYKSLRIDAGVSSLEDTFIIDR